METWSSRLPDRGLCRPLPLRTECGSCGHPAGAARPHSLPWRRSASWPLRHALSPSCRPCVYLCPLLLPLTASWRPSDSAASTLTTPGLWSPGPALPGCFPFTSLSSSTPCPGAPLPGSSHRTALLCPPCLLFQTGLLFGAWGLGDLNTSTVSSLCVKGCRLLEVILHFWARVLPRLRCSGGSRAQHASGTRASGSHIPGLHPSCSSRRSRTCARTRTGIKKVPEATGGFDGLHLACGVVCYRAPCSSPTPRPAAAARGGLRMSERTEGNEQLWAGGRAVWLVLSNNAAGLLRAP